MFIIPHGLHLYFWTGNIITVYNSEGDVHLEVTTDMTIVSISHESLMDDVTGVQVLSGSTSDSTSVLERLEI